MRRESNSVLPGNLQKFFFFFLKKFLKYLRHTEGTEKNKIKPIH
jgi:hypothetical protein